MREMKTETLVDMFLNGPGIESENVEFKHKDKLDGGKKQIAKTVSAMTNTEGGSIIVGVSKDDYTDDFQDFDKDDESELYLHQSVRDNTRPHMDDRIEIYYPEVDGHRILRIDIEKGYQNLIYFKGSKGYAAWKRSGSGNQKMSPKERKDWQKARFSNVEHDLTESEDMVKKSSAYARGGYEFDEPEGISKFEEQPDYFFLDKKKGGFMNTLFKSPRDAIYGYQFEAWNLDVDGNNYRDFLKAFAETFPRRGEGAFSITQEGGNWVGFGIKEFIQCIDDMKKRYEKYHENHESHTSELAILTAETRFGTVFIYFYYYVQGDKPVFRKAKFYLMTKGIPYNTYPVSVFLEAFGTELKRGESVPDDIGVENEVGYDRGHRDKEPSGPELDAIKPIKYPYDGGITASISNDVNWIVFENPFYENKELASKELGVSKYVKRLVKLERLIGKLNYPVKDFEGAKYYLGHIRIFNTGEITGKQSMMLDIDIEPKEN